MCDKSFKAECEKRWVRCVEELLETNITQEQLLISAEVLSTSQYADVVEERNIVGLCGYPLCNTALGPIPKQKYHVSLAKKQIFDLTERKKYCSEVCYKSSGFFSLQLPQTPLWLRAEARKTNIRLMSCNNSNMTTDTTNTTTSTSDAPDSSSQSSQSSPPKVDATRTSSGPVASTPPTTKHTAGGKFVVKEKVSKAAPPSAGPVSTGSDKTSVSGWTKPDSSGINPPKVSQVSKILGAISTWVSVPRGEACPRLQDSDSHHESATTQCETKAGDLGPARANVTGDGSHNVEQQSHGSDEMRSAKSSTLACNKDSQHPTDQPGGADSVPQEGRSVTEEGGGEAVLLPPVDSVDVSRIQRNLFNTQLRKHLSAVCSATSLSPHHILPRVNARTALFRLTRHCITFRVPEWRIIALLLITISCEEVAGMEREERVRQWLREIKATPDDFKLMLASFDQQMIQPS